VAVSCSIGVDWRFLLTARRSRSAQRWADKGGATMDMSWMAEHQLLAAAGVYIEDGLTEAELERAEGVVGARFPPDLRAFLAEGLPLGGGFPDWRTPNSRYIRWLLDWPFEDFPLDSSHNVIWLDAWGDRPQRLDHAQEIARTHVAAAPRLIPICDIYYIPADPPLAGNPVFWVYGKGNIVCYGVDLPTYLRVAFAQLPFTDAVATPTRSIRFWSDFDRGEWSYFFRSIRE
jgi:hypothetical protein